MCSFNSKLQRFLLCMSSKEDEKIQRVRPFRSSLPIGVIHATMSESREGGHKQLISNGGGFKLAFAERDKKHKMIDLRGISSNWYKTQFLKNLWGQRRPYDIFSVCINTL
jgi:hypothetical protein